MIYNHGKNLEGAGGGEEEKKVVWSGLKPHRASTSHGCPGTHTQIPSPLPPSALRSSISASRCPGRPRIPGTAGPRDASRAWNGSDPITTLKTTGQEDGKPPRLRQPRWAMRQCALHLVLGRREI